MNHHHHHSSGSSSSSNPAALQGWVKSTDPQTGRVFYANHLTRKTQWDAPEGWVDVVVPPTTTTTTTSNRSILGADEEEGEPLPSQWEVMHDPTTGKPFYVDHERKITTWVRPRATTTTTPAAASLQPAQPTSPPSSGSVSSAMARILQQQQPATSSTTSHMTTSSTSSSGRGLSTYEQEVMAYYRSQTNNNHSYSSGSTSGHHAPTVDFSDALPSLEFQVQKVPDALRPSCPGCQALFTMSKRRHHCRLCGDVFCDACSAHRVELPLAGAEFDKPVRVCDLCHVDVQRGNFFSWRRYLTPLHLYLPADQVTPLTATGEDGAAAPTADWVNAALSALSTDLEQLLENPTSSSSSPLQAIPAHLLVPAILKHLAPAATADRAVVCLAALAAFESLAEGSSTYSAAMYLYGRKPAKTTTTSSSSSSYSKSSTSTPASQSALDDLLLVLERSGTDRRTLYVQEQACRTLFYLTESRVVNAVVTGATTSSDATTDATGQVEDLDLVRAVRNLLDHASSPSPPKNPNLPRWAAATIKNLIAEDQRRACLAVNDVAALVASGEAIPAKMPYESFMDQLVNTGGIMILCSLMGTDDADTRAHAVSALGAVLTSTRALDYSLAALAEMTAGAAGRLQSQDGEIVRAIVAGGGCGTSVSQLLVSADTAVAAMGSSLLASLVRPLLADKHGSSLPREYNYRTDPSAGGACREAALEIATGPCLPALLSLVREGRPGRPLEVRQMGMETLAAVVTSVGGMGQSWTSEGQYEEGLERAGAPAKLKEGMVMLNEEGVVQVALEILQSSAGQSLGSMGTKETPASRIREAAGLILSAMVSCSAEAIMAIQSRPQVLSQFLLASNDASMTTASSLRGDGAPRCLGMVETVAAVLMFAWQHPSGAASELLDRLLEVLDAGAIPYLSKVLNIKLDWDSPDKAVGGMKGRAAACRFLCCLFGIALGDATGIGMRRLMEAVAADAHGYRKGERTPSNIVEAVLAVLQTASTQARRVLVGEASSSQGGLHDQAALMDLVDAALLAAGSMCGSSMAPGGSHGTLITGETFLTTRTDPYVDRRNEICKVACEVVVRGGASGPALLPTMLVGGFGEGATLSSLRLALAIAQNGTKDQHAKLALSGILVPVSDLLRSALTSGDLYKFSAALALVRFCGPHVAAGQGGGLESVRAAIRVATNVLVLPVNPDASLEQIETQESLKSECIAALESLSKNASLWSTISTDALPSIVQYLHTTTGMSMSNPSRQATRCAALRAVLQIVQVPSHAVSAAASGVVQPLGKLLAHGEDMTQEDEVPMLALEILHVISNNQQARSKAQFLETGLARSICAAVGKSATDQPKQPSDSRADVAFLGLEILHSLLVDIEGDAPSQYVLQSHGALTLMEAVASEPRLTKALCATLLLKTGMKLPRHDSDNSEVLDFDIPRVYGPPLILVQETCAGYTNTHDAAAALFFKIAVFACAIDSPRSEEFWSSVLLQDTSTVSDLTDRRRAASTLCAHFLSLLTAEYAALVPTDPRKKQDFFALSRPLVRHRLLESFKTIMDELSAEVTYGPSDPYVTSLIVGFNLPYICLSLWKDPALLDLAFGLIKQIMDQDPDEVLHLFVQSKEVLLALFDLLNIDNSADTSSNVGEIKRFLATLLGQLAENGLLKEAIERLDVRSSAISALAAACLSEEERHPDEDEETTSSRLSTVLMRCLVELCTVKQVDGSDKKRIALSAVESAAIAKNLGKKICHMVLSRFLERAKLQQYDMDFDENIMDAPDVAMLCAVAQHDEALLTLRGVGGLHALGLVAAEGEISALIALRKACTADAKLLLEADTYKSLMKMLAKEGHNASAGLNSELDSIAFELLARLCADSSKGRAAVASSDHCEDCVVRASSIIMSFVSKEENPAELTEANREDVPPYEGEEGDEPVIDEEAEKAASLNGTVEQGPAPKFDLRQIDNLEGDLGISACKFLSAIVLSKSARDALITQVEFFDAISVLVTTSTNAELQLAALNVLTACAPFVTTDGPLSGTRLSEVIVFILSSEISMAPTAAVNANQLYQIGLSGLSVVFDSIILESQKELSKRLANLFVKNVKAVTSGRIIGREREYQFTADLMYHLSLIMILSRSRPFVDEVFTQDVLTSMAHVVQWRFDPKTTIPPADQKPWDGCTSNVLFLISSLIWRPEEILVKAGINLTSLAGTNLMLARPGKAPRRAMDLKAALQRIVDEGDGASALAAQRTLDRLY